MKKAESRKLRAEDGDSPPLLIIHHSSLIISSAWAWDDPDRVQWFLADQQGTVRDVLDRTGNHRLHVAFDAFGAASELRWTVAGGVTGSGAVFEQVVTAAAGFDLTAQLAAVGRYWFQGRELDAWTHFYYVRARWLDPLTGTWLNPDPIFDDLRNTYRFVGNDPVNHTDPTGLAEWGSVEWFQDFYGRYGKVEAGYARLSGDDYAAVIQRFRESGEKVHALVWQRVGEVLRAEPGVDERTAFQQVFRKHLEATLYNRGDGMRGHGWRWDEYQRQLEALRFDDDDWLRDRHWLFAGCRRFLTPSQVNPHGGNLDNCVAIAGSAAVVARGVGSGSHVGAAQPPRITFGHGARHLEGSGLSQATVESAIEGAVRAVPNAGTHWGWVQVEGQWIQYRAFVRPDGTVNIGTYVRVPNNLSNAKVR